MRRHSSSRPSTSAPSSSSLCFRANSWFPINYVFLALRSLTLPFCFKCFSLRSNTTSGNLSLLNTDHNLH
ncbi:unnamed protein product, partial [Sphenostylis stenocarpa]